MFRRATRGLWLVVLAAGGGCAGGAEDVGSAQEALTPVTWTNAVGVSAVANDLTKTDPGTAWNAGASSLERLPSDGFIEFTTGEATTDKMAGLGSGDSNQGYADIEFAIRLNDAGRVTVFESGTRVFTGGRYAAGDRFRIRVLDRVVTYWQNGRLLYTSAAVPPLSLAVDTSLRTPGATVTDVAMENQNFWDSMVRVRAVANDLVKTDTSDLWNAGAIGGLTALFGDGYVQFTTRENTTDKAAGLSNNSSSPSRGDIDFAIALRANGQFQVFESNVLRGTFGRYLAGDVFRVEVAGGVVTYWKNTSPFYTSTLAPSFPLLLDTSLRTPGATIEDARVVPGPIEEPVCTPHSERLRGDELPTPDVIDFGYSLDMAGDILVAGTPYSNPPFAAVFRQAAGDYQLEQVLTLAGVARLADRVATDGQTIALTSSPGLVYLFRHDGIRWALEDTVGCPVEADVVTVRGDLLVVGDNYRNSARAGLAQVYRRGANGWTLEAILIPSDGVPYDYFGLAVAIGGDRIFIGAPLKDSTVDRGGAVYVYRHDPTAPAGTPTCSAPAPGRWRQEAILHQATPERWDHFGISIEANAGGSEIAVGNSQNGGNGPGGGDTPNGPGKAHVFAFDGFGWNETAVLTPASPDPVCLDDSCDFGASLAWGGPDPEAPSILLLGATFLGPANTYVFQRLSGAWVESGNLTEPDGVPRPYTRFGKPVAAGASSVAIADSGWDGAGPNAGAVHVYDLLECPAP